MLGERAVAASKTTPRTPSRHTCASSAGSWAPHRKRRRGPQVHGLLEPDQSPGWSSARTGQPWAAVGHALARISP